MKTGETLTALIAAKRYSKLINGTTISLPTGEAIDVKLSVTKKPNWLINYKTHAYTSTLTGNGFTSLGCGEDNNKLIALQKSISESFERLVFMNLKGTKHSTLSTNGWACHPNIYIAQANAMIELLERDASLAHFLKQQSFIELTDIPKPISAWASKTKMKTQLTDFKILLSTEGFIPTASVLMTDKHGKGLITHAADANILAATNKAITELSRIINYQNNKAYKFLSKQLHSEQQGIRFTPAHHALAYSFDEQIPEWLVGSKLSYSSADSIWSKRLKGFNPDHLNLKFNVLTSDPLFVVNCQSELVQDLYFGSTEQAMQSGLINYDRLGTKNINLKPHFVA